MSINTSTLSIPSIHYKGGTIMLSPPEQLPPSSTWLSFQAVVSMTGCKELEIFEKAQESAQKIATSFLNPDFYRLDESHPSYLRLINTLPTLLTTLRKAAEFCTEDTEALRKIAHLLFSTSQRENLKMTMTDCKDFIENTLEVSADRVDEAVEYYQKFYQEIQKTDRIAHAMLGTQKTFSYRIQAGPINVPLHLEPREEEEISYVATVALPESFRLLLTHFKIPFEEVSQEPSGKRTVFFIDPISLASSKETSEKLRVARKVASLMNITSFIERKILDLDLDQLEVQKNHSRYLTKHKTDDVLFLAQILDIPLPLLSKLLGVKKKQTLFHEWDLVVENLKKKIADSAL